MTDEEMFAVVPTGWVTGLREIPAWLAATPNGIGGFNIPDWQHRVLYAYRGGWVASAEALDAILRSGRVTIDDLRHLYAAMGLEAVLGCLGEYDRRFWVEHW